MYFSRGNLPWQERYLGGGKGGTKEDKYRRILDKKDCPSTCAMSIHQTNLQQTKEKDTIFVSISQWLLDTILLQNRQLWLPSMPPPKRKLIKELHLMERWGEFQSCEGSCGLDCNNPTLTALIINRKVPHWKLLANLHPQNSMFLGSLLSNTMCSWESRVKKEA